jgi:hypothetical protein
MIDDPSSYMYGPFTNKNRDYHIDVYKKKLDIRKYLLKSYLLEKYNRDIELIDNITIDNNVEDIFYLGLLKEKEEKLKANFKEMLKPIFISFLNEQHDIVYDGKMEHCKHELCILKLAICCLETKWQEKQEEIEEKQYVIIGEVEENEELVLLVDFRRVIVVMLYAIMMFMIVIDVNNEN